ncbi:MAG: GUN4 domain-containing protein [Cyanosarcina radialis HA8281-LM2]|jgi:serine/threonine protein kinase|nr:GUN4 domain-containing protein [Cyanosarcina radialis HA8281-LM2]
MAWVAGQKLYGDRYIIQKELGKGGFGVTYLATDKKGNLVVIKTLKDDVLSDSQISTFRDKLLRDFRDEALRLALCRHPHIVCIENAFYEGLLPCIVMEYVEGEDLWEIVEKYGALSEAEALRYIWQIGQALMVMHDKGLLHRDIKPQNIMVRAGKSEAVLIDFGVAREFISDVTMMNTQTLTQGFAPIEQYAPQARRGEYTDVYALAATLYYLLTKQMPLPAPAMAAKIPLTPPQQLNPTISDRVNEAIIKGMAFAGEHRPPSVEAWLEIAGNPDPAPANPAVPSAPPPVAPPVPVAVEKPSTQSSLTPHQIQLSSEVGADYRPLEDLLSAQKWREADEETRRVMLKVANREKEGWLDATAIDRFPCRDLLTIDRLWVKYSKGRFGFSIQKQVWEGVGGQANSDWETYCRFGDRVGWRVNGNWVNNNNINFDPMGSLGHLPICSRFSGLFWVRVISSLAARLLECGI